MKALLATEHFYWVIGAIFATMSLRVAREAGHRRRLGTALFWGVLAVIYLGGKSLPPLLVGILVVGLVALASLRQVERSAETTTGTAERQAEAERLGNRLFVPALLVPVLALAGSLTLGRIGWGEWRAVDPKQVTLVALGLAALGALAVAVRLTGDRWRAPAHEGGRLLHAIGWALVLPQLLAALGTLFAQAGVGEVVAGLVTRLLPTQWPFVAAAAYCVGMAAFTMCLGNAFAAFAVITGGIGLPLVVQQHHGNPAIMAALGMLSGYCGTLMTPMAANFNIVPAMLLDLRDRHAVVRAQVPLGLAILAANILLLYTCAYRF